MTTLQCCLENEAFAHLERKYGSRPELDLHHRMFAFETEAQREMERIKDLVMRLELLVVELNLMAK
jgi:hypothetical protein